MGRLEFTLTDLLRQWQPQRTACKATTESGSHVESGLPGNDVCIMLHLIESLSQPSGDRGFCFRPSADQVGSLTRGLSAIAARYRPLCHDSVGWRLPPDCAAVQAQHPYYNCKSSKMFATRDRALPPRSRCLKIKQLGSRHKETLSWWKTLHTMSQVLKRSSSRAML